MGEPLTNRLDSRQKSVSSWTEKEKRINSTYRPTLARFIHNFEKKYQSQESFEDIIPMLTDTIENKATSYYRRFQRAGYQNDDFKQLLWLKALEIVDGYEPRQTEFELYETIRRFVHQRVLDYLREESRRYKRENVAWAKVKAQSIPAEFEDDLCNRQCVSQILSAPCLTDEERRLLCLIYAYPDDSLAEIGRKMQYTNRMTVGRALNKIRTKLLPTYAEMLQ